MPVEKCPSHLQELQSLLGTRFQQCDGAADHEGDHRKEMRGYALVWNDEASVLPVDPILHFTGGPWHGTSVRGRAVSARLVEDDTSGAYWLDTNSGNAPAYYWASR